LIIRKKFVENVLKRKKKEKQKLVF